MSTAINVKEGRPISVKVYDIPNVKMITQLMPTGEAIEIPDIISFSYYESVYDSFIFARLTIFDSAGALQKAFGGCGIRNLCAVEIEFNDPSTGTNYQRSRNQMNFGSTNCFYVSKIANQLVQGKKQIYEIELMNRDALCSTHTNIYTSWPSDGNDGSIEYNVPIYDVLTKVINSKKDVSNITTEKTKPVKKITGNGLRPFQFIAECCKQATSLKFSGSGNSAADNLEKGASGYLFWETYDKYNFISIAKLLTNPAEIPTDHRFKVSIVNDSETVESEASQRILQYKFNDDANTSDVIQEITSGSRGKPRKYLFDTTRNVYKKIESVAESIADKCVKTVFDNSFNMTEYLHQSEYQIEYMVACDSKQLNSEPVHPALTSLNYSAILEGLRTKVSSIRVPGNLSISAGDHIFVEVPTIQGDGSNTTQTDNKYTGIYLVVKVSHRLEDIKNSFTDLEISQIKQST